MLGQHCLQMQCRFVEIPRALDGSNNPRDGVQETDCLDKATSLL
jgi:hypothetical protein